MEIILVDENGNEMHLPMGTPAEELIAVLDRDYSSYRREVALLREEHPLFGERLDVPEEDYINFVADAGVLIPDLAKVDPIAAFVATQRLMGVLQMKDDGSAMHLLKSGAKILRHLEEPIASQVRLRNIFEVAFDDHERGSQRDRFDALEQVWPGLLDRFFLMRRVPEPEGDMIFGKRWEYSPANLYELYLSELSLYFQQSTQRIVRCENCWHYFIPKTKKETLYCDREFDGVSCKKIGPNLKRKLGPEYDEALRLYKQLYARMAERLDRYVTAPENDRGGLIPMGFTQFDEWVTTASKARTDYVCGKISSEEFLRTIDKYGELPTYQTSRTEPTDPNNTPWRRRVRSNIDFDPERDYQDLALLDLRKGEEIQWEDVTAEEQIKHDRAGVESLREKYKKDNE